MSTREPSPEELALEAVAGILASGVSAELARPLRQLRENLALMVETLDRYVAEARGPTPYPWTSLQLLRQELADSYLLSRSIARLAGDLADAVNVGSVPELVDPNKQVEAAMHLARHRINSRTEVFIDLGMVPPVRAVASELMLAVAQLVIVAASSAGALPGAALSLRTRHEREAGEVCITVADNGGGDPAGAERAEVVAGAVARGLGGSFAGTSEPGKGSFLELRIPVR